MQRSRVRWAQRTQPVEYRRRWCREKYSHLISAATAPVALWLFAVPVFSSPEPTPLLQQGAAALASRNYEAALEKFEAASQADPADAEGAFFQGVALNRLGRFRDAWIKLQHARTLGVAHPDFAFELGWSLVGLRRWLEAVTQLENYEKAHPGRGQTQELLGRAYIGLGQYQKADAALDEALKRDPELADSVRLHKALLEHRQRDTQGVRQNLSALMQDSPDSPLGRVIRNQVGATGVRLDAQEAPQKPWQVQVSAGVGYNSNALFVGEGVPLPGGGDKSDGFARFEVDGSYRWQLRDTDTLTAGYSFQGDYYFDLSQADEDDHFLYLDYNHDFNEKWSGALRLSDNFTQVGGDRFRNQIAVRPALIYRHNDRQASELSFSYADNNYYFPSTAVRDRDGYSQTVALTHFYNSRSTRWQARGGIFHTRNSADGDDFDFDSTGIYVGLSHRLPWEVTGDLFYSHSWDRYDNRNSLSTPAFSARRRDDVDSFSLQLTKPLSRQRQYGLDVYLRYTYARDDSNIRVFKYSQHVISAGISGSF